MINDISKEGHECHNLNAKEKIVLISHTPDNISLLFTDPETGNGITVQLVREPRGTNLPSATASLTAHPATIASTDMNRVREPAARQKAKTTKITVHTIPNVRLRFSVIILD